ncbi:MAG: glycoside hydrolase family 28 protein, partial [Terriglobales bacterium]
MSGSAPCLAAAAALLLLAAVAAPAQDSRQVREPRFPPTGVVLAARRQGPGGHAALDTARIQQAIAQCPPGHSVLLRRQGPDDAFVSGPLRLRPGVTLRIGRGVTLYAARNPRLYDRRPGSCGILDRGGHGCWPFILVANAPDAAVMGPGTINGQGGRRWRGHAPARPGAPATWWALARQAQRRHLRQNCPRLLLIKHSDNFTLYRLRLVDAANFHVLFARGRGFTAWGVIVDTPATARNTDGIDVLSGQDVSILHCYIHAGDDDVAIKAGVAGPARDITVANDHFYTGHGMSIGSETSGGVSAVRVRNLTVDGAVNGLRIKSNASRGGLVTNVTYDNICLRDVRHPIVVNAFYGLPRHGRAAPAGGSPPVFRGIVFRRVTILGAGRIVLDGYS